MSAVKQIQDCHDKENPNECVENLIVVEEKSSDKSTNDVRSIEKSEEERGRDDSTISNSVVRSAFEIDESNKKNRWNESNCFAYLGLKQKTILLWIERIVLTCICVGVAAGFTTPIIIYALDKDVTYNANISIGDIDVDNCTGSNTCTEDAQVC